MGRMECGGGGGAEETIKVALLVSQIGLDVSKLVSRARVDA